MTRIDGICHERMYLVEGERCAALVDCGSGFGSLRRAVEKLTKKPVTLLLTHGHVDHAMGAAEFDKVFMSPLDRTVFDLHGEKQFRLDGLAFSRERNSVTEDDYIPTADPTRFRALSEGDVFDLGGTILETYACPGHTPGSVVFLDRARRILYVGDAFSNSTFLIGPTALTVEDYARSLCRLQSKIDGAYERVLESHGTGELPQTILSDVLNVCEDLLCGKTDRIPYEFRGLRGFLAKAWRPHSLRRVDGGTGNLIYDEDRIWRENL